LTAPQVFYRIFLALQHRFRAVNEHGLHSPFVFDWYRAVYRGHLPQGLIQSDRELKNILLSDHTAFQVKDFGAGGYRLKTVSRVAKREELPDRWRHRLAKIVEQQGPGKLLELGTSLGLSTLLMARVCPEAAIYTVEGDPATAAKARALFEIQGRSDIRLFEMTIEDFLEQKLSSIGELDLVFIDANHRLEPTLKYAEALIPQLSSGGMLILDDINWSEEMQEAWKQVRRKTDFELSLDLGRMGVLIRRKGMLKQQFCLRG
jgi:predicted O-methyltransferase YrrM